MKFENYPISPEIKKSLAELGFKRPTDIQFKAITPIFRGEDVLAIAQTGTGKTAAFTIPVLQMLMQRPRQKSEKAIRCLVMEPTHELAVQVAGVFESIGRYTKLSVLALYGGVDQQPQIDKLSKGVDILVATPGRVFDLLYQKHLNLNETEFLILDEADHMLDKGFLKDIQDLLNFIPRRRQTLFFSATIDEKIKKLAYSLVHKAIRIQLSPKDPVSRNIQHAVTYIEMDDKRFFLERFIGDHTENKILVFVRTKIRAERVCKAMERVDVQCITIHGDKEQTARADVMQLFKSGTCNVLIATDVSARGVDIPNVDYVVNYDVPDKPENYVHRVGRTGRGMNKGQAITFCSKEEKPVLDEIEQFLKKPITVLDINRTDYKETIEMSDAVEKDWRSLIKAAEESGLDEFLEKKARRKAKKKKDK
jgi:ATP-dependent RNA helicase RhlE